MADATKLLFALEAPGLEARDELVAWARSSASHDAVTRAELELVDEDVQRAHTTKPLRYHGFVSLWIAADAADAADAVLRSRPAGTAWFRVRDRVAFDRSGRPDEARPWAGVKKTTPWTHVDGVDPVVWQGRYTNHGYIAAAHHATCVRYRQNVVLDGSDPAISAVSELWFTNVEDLVERFTRSPEAAHLVQIDSSGFVDATRAHPTVTTHEILRIAAA